MDLPEEDASIFLGIGRRSFFCVFPAKVILLGVAGFAHLLPVTDFLRFDHGQSI